MDYQDDTGLARQAARFATVRDVKGELSALSEACVKEKSPAAIRDAVMIALAWSTGLPTI